MAADQPSPATEPDRPRRRTLWWILGGIAAAVILFFGAIFFYANVINDSPDAFDEDDLDAALESETTEPPEAIAPTDTPAPSDTATIETTPGTDAAPETETTSAPAADGFDGTWLPTADSEFGYRVEEVLAGVNTSAVGRSNEIDGTLVIAGTTAEIDTSVQVENITSGDGRRDGQFRGNIMDAENFPTATFVTTEPIDFGAIPADGEQVTATATGELTLRGVTQPVTFDVTAQVSGDRIGVLGSIPVVFEDYGIANPSNSFVTTESDGLVEFVLVFERQA
jgi:polyisoprenoid-binding protein YceI